MIIAIGLVRQARFRQLGSRLGWFALALMVATSSVAAVAEDVRIGTLNCNFLILRKVHMKYELPFDEREWNEEQRATWSQPGYREARFQESVAAIANSIKDINADVLVLTEVGKGDDITALWNEVNRLGLAYAHRVEGVSTDTITGQNVAVFSRLPLSGLMTSIPGRETYEEELDDPETERDTGISKGLKVAFQLGGNPVYLFACHLASERGGHEKDQQRIAQASVVRRNYLPLLNEGAHVIVAGDINDKRGDPTLRRIRGKDDIWEDLVQTGLSRFFPPEQIENRYTFVFNGERQQIDHVLISNSIVQACRSGGVVAETVAAEHKLGDTAFPATDHRALVVTLRLP